MESTVKQYDYRKLIGKIAEVTGTKADFAVAIGMNRATLTQKLNNRVAFSQQEIDRACSVLGIEVSDIPVYFFTPDVGKSPQADCTE